VKQRPADAGLRLEYADLLAGDQERRSDAIREYRTVVDAEPTPETREALADLLSGRSDGRAQALELYEALVREKPDDVELRIKYARLLAGRREDTRRAIDQYEIVVQHDPRSAAGHAGLAAGYAALGDPDRALQHSNLAVEYGARENELDALRKDLLRGREPNLEVFAHGLVQRGKSKSKLDGTAGGLAGRVDAGTVLTLRAQGGGEDYWSGGQRAAGAFARVDTDFHIDPENEIGLGVGYHTLGERSIPGRLEYNHLGESWKLGIGAERSLRYDSYVALVGDRVNGRTIGSARENRLHLLARYEGTRATLSLEPYGGFVDATNVAANPFGGGRVELRYRIYDGERLQISPILAGEVFHYHFNAFGVNLDPGEPKPGGYFSPQLFGSGEPGMALSARLGENHFLDLEGGPAVQYVKEQGTKSDLGLGGQGRFEYVYFLRPSIYWSIGAEVQSFGAAYTRGTATTRLAFEF
jgi:tetratricopeptide (TPR) repeat protein